MYKRTQLRTYLALPLDRADSYLELSVGACLYLNSVLTEHDWTYLLVSSDGIGEIVKVLNVYNTRVSVARGLENTDREIFSAGASVEYAPTVLELLDSISVDTLVINTLGAIRIDKGVVSIPAVNILGLGSVDDGLPLNTHTTAECCGVEAPAIPPMYSGYRTIDDGSFRTVDDGSYRTIE